MPGHFVLDQFALGSFVFRRAPVSHEVTHAGGVAQRDESHIWAERVRPVPPEIALGRRGHRGRSRGGARGGRVAETAEGPDELGKGERDVGLYRRGDKVLGVGWGGAGDTFSAGLECSIPLA